MSDFVDIKPRGHKAPLQLLPNTGLRHLACAIEDGAVKYEPNNWRGLTPDWRATYSGAALRHLWELCDPDCPESASDTGIHHAAHAASCCLISLFHSGADYSLPVQANAEFGKTPKRPQFCGSVASYSPEFMAWSPRLDLLPYRPLCAIAGGFEGIEFVSVRSYSEVLNAALGYLTHFAELERQGDNGVQESQILALAAANCLLLLSYPDDHSWTVVRPSKNVVADAFIRLGQPQEHRPEIDDEALARMLQVQERRNADLQLQM